MSIQVLSRLVEMTDPASVLTEVKSIVSSISPQFDFAAIDRAYGDVTALFNGDYPGYRQCNTLYHDLQHTTDCFLAQARLIHGATLTDMPLPDETICLGLVCSLMHDTGYIQSDDDTSGTGAKHTLNHVDRSIEFMQTYCTEQGIFPDRFQDMEDILSCTGLKTHIATISFSSPDVEFLGKALGSSDLMGQMGDRTYLEKLIFLFEEFVEAGIPGMTNEYDFLVQTRDFYARTYERLEKELSNVRRYERHHFNARYQIDQDLYGTAMEANLAFLLEILKQDKQNFIRRLRRRGLPEYLKKTRPALAELNGSAWFDN